MTGSTVRLRRNTHQDKTQLQAMLGGEFAIRDGLSLSFGVLGGKYGATPSLGGQIGVAVDIPTSH
jgi:hypothetical protein